MGGGTSKQACTSLFDLSVSACAKATHKVSFTLYSHFKPRPVLATQHVLPCVILQDPNWSSANQTGIQKSLQGITLKCIPNHRYYPQGQECHGNGSVESPLVASVWSHVAISLTVRASGYTRCLLRSKDWGREGSQARLGQTPAHCQRM